MRLGIVCDTGALLHVVGIDGRQHAYPGWTVPLRSYRPVDATVRVNTAEENIVAQAREFATDCLNQAGLGQLMVFANARTPA